MKIINYNINSFPFAKNLCDIFGVNNLENLNEDIPVFKRETDQSTVYHKLFYDWSRTEYFKIIYDTFVSDVVYPLYNEPIVYQTIPTFRIAYPNNIAVGEFHKDKQYRDISWSEQVKESNFFLPFTDAYDTNTIWVESKEDEGDYQPMNCKYGQIIQWDGSNLTHGNKINTTGKTRVSVDFRVISHQNYMPSNRGSINMNTKFEIGGYYTLMDK